MSTRYVVALVYLLSQSIFAEDSHEKNIRTLFQALEMKAVYEERVDQLVKAQESKMENFSHFEMVVRQWAVDTIGWKTLEPELVAIYKRHLSESDIKKITQFYQSSAGQKLQKVQPDIAREAQALAADAARKNAKQLQVALKQKVEEIEKQEAIEKNRRASEKKSEKKE